MDNNVISGASSQIPPHVSRVGGVTPSGGQAVQGQTTTGSSGISESARTLIDHQLFALEPYVPVQILQNPELLKAEWAWKLFLMQQLALKGMFEQVSTPSHSSQEIHSSQTNQGEMSQQATTQELHAQSSSSRGTPLLSKAGTPEQQTMSTASSGIPIQDRSVTSARVLTETMSQTGAQTDPSLATTSGRESSSEGQPPAVQGASVAASQSPSLKGAVSPPPSPPSGQVQEATHGNSQANGANVLRNANTVAPNVAPSPVQPVAQAVVQQLWSALTLISRQSESGPKHVYVNERTDSPIVPFSSMNQENIAQGHTQVDQNRLSAWVLEDRMVSSVLDNPYEQIGGGIFYPPEANESTPPHHAVKWKAHRQTRIGAGGKLVHRIRFEVDVRGHPLTCILTAQRPQLLVHFVSDHVKLRSYLEQGRSLVDEPLRQNGWDLVSWTAGEPSSK